MQKPASLVALKNIFLLWSESSDQSHLKRPLSTWSEDIKHALHFLERDGVLVVRLTVAGLYLPGDDDAGDGFAGVRGSAA